MAYTRTVFKSQNLLGIIITVQDLFAYCPAETNHFSELAYFGILKVHLTVQNEIDMCFGGLVLFVDALIGFYSEEDAVLEQVFECINCQQMEDWVLQPDPTHH